MKRFFRSLAVFLIAASFLISLSLPAAAASTDAEAQRWNIMLVVDGSGSLDTSNIDPMFLADKDKLRFDAIGSFLDVLQDDGHNVGAIVFEADQVNAYGSNGTSAKLIRENTGLMSFDEEGAAYVKSTIINELRDDRTTTHSGPTTDFYSAFLVALQELERSGNKDLPTAVFLFTDGALAVENLNAAEANRKKAIEMFQNWNAGNGGNPQIELCGVYLNAVQQGGTRSNSTDLERLVRDAYGLAPNAGLGNSYLTIENATDCKLSADKFMRLLGYSIPDNGDAITFTDHLSETFSIPGFGVEEVNIRFSSTGGKQLPDMDITVTDPDNNVIPEKDLGGSCDDRNRTIKVIKIRQPKAGEWKIEAQVRGDNNVDISYTPIYSFHAGAKLEATPATGDMHRKQDVTIRGWLTDDDVGIQDPGCYEGYDCYLTLKDTSGDVVYDGQIHPVNDAYETTIFFDDNFVSAGKYTALVRFECGNISVSSKAVEWDLTNRLPVCDTDTYRPNTIEYGFLKPSTATLDLSNAFSDPEDGRNIELFIDENRTECDPDGLEIDGTELIITSAEAGSGAICVYAVDQDGGSTQNSALSTIHIRTEDVTIRIILTLAVCSILLIILIVVIILLRSRYVNGHKPQGDCRLTVEVDNKALIIDLTPPGVKGKRSTNLYAMVQRALAAGRESEYSALATECRKLGISFDDLEEILREDAAELKKVAVSVQLGKVKGKKGKTAKILVAYQKSKAVLYNRSFSLTLNGNSYDFGYHLADYSNDDIFNDYGAQKRKEEQGADLLFDDFDFGGTESFDPAPQSRPARKQPKKSSTPVSQGSDLLDDF